MAIAIITVAVIGLALALVVLVARDTGPPPSDVALAYESAWDHLDFESLWVLSGDELRDGLDRKAFVAAKTSAYAAQRSLGGLTALVAVEDERSGDTISTVRTRVDLKDGGTARNELQLVKRAGRWVVVGYSLRSNVQH